MTLTSSLEHGRPSQRQRCPLCPYIHYDNPTPVVGCIVEMDNQVLLCQNVGWPSTFFGIVTGFLERDDASPAHGILRELSEEVGVSCITPSQLTLVDVCPFPRMNQVIIVYACVLPSGTVVVPDKNEIQAIRWVPIRKLKPWNEGLL
jgi:NAD+ diphosphatase